MANKFSESGYFYCELKSLNPNKSPGPDEIHPLLLKECAQDLSTSLCTLFNLSLRQGKYPSEWKLANISPVFKKGSRSLVSNYRPVSLLSIISKLCERCVLKKLLPKVIHHLSSMQHGFVQGRSCVIIVTCWGRTVGRTVELEDL